MSSPSKIVTMKEFYLFAIDKKTEEIIISISEKNSSQIKSIGRVSRKENEILYRAVQALMLISKSPNLDLELFKLMDKVCQHVYKKYSN